jgi:hypothetical protein
VVTPRVRETIAAVRSLAPDTEALLDQLTALLPHATHVV